MRAIRNSNRFVFALYAGVVFLAGCSGSQPLPTDGSIAGTVTASQPFEAAKVYARHIQRDITYMSFTGDGSYHTVQMFPGAYEVWAEKPGLESARQEIELAPGATLNVDLELESVTAKAVGQGSFMGLDRRARAADAVWLSYDELYPEDPIKPLFEAVCVECHGKSFLSFFHKTAEQWDSSIRAMQATRIPPGRVDDDQRQALTAYLSKHFGPDSPDRRMKNETPIPLDEQALSKAQYVEYKLPLDDARPRRWVQEVHIDFEGNVWYTERTLPNAVGRLDPRTGEVKEWQLPDPAADPHGLTVDSEGYVYWAEVKQPYLGRLNPRTGEMERFPFDETGELGRLGGHTPVLDSEENVWFTVIYGDALGKWDRKTKKIQIWRVPTRLSMPYGLDVGPDDTPVLAGLYGCHAVAFDQETETFTEYPSLVQPPCVTRRLGVDSKGIIWLGVFSRGKLSKIDPKTGETVEYDMASRFSEPYDVWRDRNTDLLWISDAGQGGAIVQFNPETERFTYYPTPRRSDMPKMDVTSDGKVWYSTRAVPDGAVGVLYPDKYLVSSREAKR